MKMPYPFRDAKIKKDWQCCDQREQLCQTASKKNVAFSA